MTTVSYMEKKQYVYIGSPYSHPSPLIREERYLRVSHYVVQCLRESKWAYSPIVHCHELAKTFGLGGSFDFWKDYNFAMLRGAHTLEVFRLEGWDQSIGLTAEIEEAQRLGIPVVYV